MKICWDNLEKLRYNSNTGKWYKGKNTYIYMDSCEECGEPYLTFIKNKNIGKFCSSKCSNIKNKDKYNITQLIKHKMSKTLTYNSWHHMKDRCLNSNNDAYEKYGGRGIKICERWLGEHGFENFLADMGERPEGLTLDRIDNNGNYEPINCRWTTWDKQERNRRNSKLNEEKVKEIKKIIEENNLTQQQIADTYNVCRQTISDIKNNRRWRNI